MKTNDQITDTRSNKTSVTSETDVSKIISVLGDKINTSDLLSAIMELAVKPVENSGDEQMNKLAFIKNRKSKSFTVIRIYIFALFLQK